MIRLRPALAALALVALPALSGCREKGAAADCSVGATNGFVLEVARSWYLYDTAIPAGIDPAAYPTTAALLAKVTEQASPKIRSFSYLTTGAASDQFFQEGTSQGYGIGLRYLGQTRVLVTQVFGGSPAAQAGFARGDELLAVAPSAALLDAPASQVSALLSASATDNAAFSAALGSGLLGATRSFRVLRADGVTSATLTATIGLFSLDPVPAPAVLEVGGKKVGYLLLRSFITPAVTPLRDAFASFKSQGITDLILDLRYNGGGQLSVASRLLDLLADGRAGDATHPAGVKYGLRHNGQHAAEDVTESFHLEASALAPGRVAFIVTEASASASELIPFALLPYMGPDVALVGAPTYGKPAGQYGFEDPGCPSLLYLLSFQLANRDGLAGYFTGLPDTAFAAAGASCAAEDDLAHPLGDPAEGSTAAALRWIADGSCPTGPIPPTDAPAPLARRVAAAAFPEPPEPSLAQRHLPGLF